MGCVLRGWPGVRVAHKARLANYLVRYEQIPKLVVSAPNSYVSGRANGFRVDLKQVFMGSNCEISGTPNQVVSDGRAWAFGADQPCWDPPFLSVPRNPGEKF